MITRAAPLADTCASCPGSSEATRMRRRAFNAEPADWAGVTLAARALVVDVDVPRCVLRLTVHLSAGVEPVHVRARGVPEALEGKRLWKHRAVAEGAVRAGLRREVVIA